MPWDPVGYILYIYLLYIHLDFFGSGLAMREFVWFKFHSQDSTVLFRVESTDMMYILVYFYMGVS